MNKEQDHASDSDESDEDFCPDNVNEEDVSGDEEEDDEDESDIEEDAEEADTNKKQAKVSAKNKAKSKTAEPTAARSTRQTEAKQNGRATAEKDELESDEEADKSRSDALWADFLGDIDTPSKQNRETKPKEKPPSPTKRTPPVTSKVSEVLEFAGEPVNAAKTVPSSSSSAKENQEQSPTVSAKATVSASPRGPFGAGKRPANSGAGGGLGSLLNQLGKKKKLSVLEKSQMDWKSFKSDEGIDEELRTHNKGKDGYLERQDFLQRTDLRQFEIEKSLRQTRRQN